MAIRIETSEYEFSHGRTPRGRGGWIFEVRDFGLDPDVVGNAGLPCRVEINDRDECLMVWLQGSMTYTEAKQFIKKWARNSGLGNSTTISVAP